MHDLLLAHQDELSTRDLVGYAEQLGLDLDRFTFFVNGRRHYGAYDIRSLSEAVHSARARAVIAGSS